MGSVVVIDIIEVTVDSEVVVDVGILSLVVDIREVASAVNAVDSDVVVDV